MKILHISSSYWPAFEMGGPIQSVHLLNKFLAKEGVEITIYTTNAGLKKDKNFQKVLDMYEMFRKIEELRKERIGEFRKNVTLKVFYQGEEININLEQLKIYADMLEKFISTTKQFLLK